MEVDVPKTKTQQCFRILQTTSSFNVPQVIKTPQEGSWRRHKCPVGFSDLFSNQTLGSTYKLSKIYDTKALLT